MPPRERLHKHLAALGLGSRRTIETWITQGRIQVDGRQAKLGESVDADSRIRIDGRAVHSPPAAARRVIAYHKPEGEISTRRDPARRPTVYQRLPALRDSRWVSVGRLDINTRGLMLFTNDGELAHTLMHPRFGLEREYLCRVYGQVTPAALARLRDGMTLDGEVVRFQQVRRHDGGDDDDGAGDGKNVWYSVVVTQGKYREIRRLWAKVDCRLSRLIRIRYGEVRLPKTLQPGHWRELDSAVVDKLLAPSSREGENPKG